MTPSATHNIDSMLFNLPNVKKQGRQYLAPRAKSSFDSLDPKFSFNPQKINAYLPKN